MTDTNYSDKKDARGAGADSGAPPAAEMLITSFAAALRQLRAQAGDPALRAMTKTAQVAPASLSGATRGQRMPSLKVTLGFVRACGGDEQEWQDRWEETTARLRTVEFADNTHRPSPYIGLRAFTLQEADLFFGRARLIDQLLDLTARSRLTAVFGPSGSGKSSFLRAGLIPRWRSIQGAGRPAAIRYLTPRATPYTDHRDRFRPADGPGDTHIVVDQFEEVFALCRDSDERERFIDLLLAAQRPDSRLRVVLAVRADFLGQCTQNPGLTEAFQQSTLLVGPMSREELKETVTGPARLRGIGVQQSLTRRVVAEAEREPAALPLMSHALDQAWQRRKGHLLDEDAYDAAGGLRNAIEQTAEDVYHGLPPESQKHVPRVLLRLVNPGDDGPDTRRPARHAELDGALDEDGVRDTRTAVDRLVATRLLTVDEDEVNLVHEALITAWPRLGDWIEAERDRLRQHRRLTAAAQDWHKLRKDPDALYRGSRLAAAREAFPPTTRDAQLTRQEADFLHASERQRSRRTHWRRTMTAAGVVLGLLAAGSAVVAFEQRATARAERNTAVFRQMTARADLVRETDRPLAARLDVAARELRDDPDLDTRLTSDAGAVLGSPLTGHQGLVTGAAFAPDGSVLASAAHDGTLRLWDTSDPRRPHAAGGPFTKLPELPEALAFAPRGHLLAIGLRDGHTLLYDTADPRRLRRLAAPLAAKGQAVTALSVSPDGTTLATGSKDGTLRLWDITDPARPALQGVPVAVHSTGGVQALDFAPDGTTLATGGHDNAVRLWDVSDPSRIQQTGKTLTGHTRPVFSLAYSPDGKTLATGSYDETMRIWDVSNPEQPRARRTPVLRAHRAGVLSVDFSPDGNTLLSGGADNSLQLWNVHNPDYGRAFGDPITGHSGGVWTARFNPEDPHTLVSSGHKGDLLLWHRPRTVLPDFTNPVLSVSVSSDGRLLAAGSESDATARLYDISNPARPRKIAGGLLNGHEGPVNSVAFGPDEGTLVTGSSDGTVRLWDVSPHSGGSLRGAALDTGQPVHSVAVSPDGRTLAAGGRRGSLRLWRLTSAGAPTPDGALPAGSQVNSLAWRSDGHTLATAHGDGSVRLWDTRTHRLLRTLTGHQGEATAVAFRSDGRTLASAGSDQTIRLWNTEDPADAEQAGPPLTGHKQKPHTLAFSSDGRRLASGGDDLTVRLWDTAVPARPAAYGQPLTGHSDSVLGVAFTPDGAFLASVGYDLTARLWSLNADTAARDVCARAPAALTPRTWRQQLPDSPFRPGCGSR
ncbi:nSTAND1 domain-containing NTPase [Streptomyces albidoflavus]|uniref:WD40 repeat domain-containing protein n=1 Tax=Streptomyces albidoflavus TaxID=1886 RepID=UPI00068F6B60|nr:WD40 repeat domain-containing protein [Streptomyces albidoflavus]